MKKLLLNVIFCLCIALALLPGAAMAADISSVSSGSIAWNDGDVITTALTVPDGTNITVTGTVTMNAGITISGGNVTISGGTLKRGGANFNMISVTGGTLTLENTTLDGDSVPCSSKCGINVNGGSVIMNDSSLINHINSSIQGSAVKMDCNSGNFTMSGGEIRNCQSNSYGGAVYMCGQTNTSDQVTFTMNSGSVSNNSTTGTGSYGGGAFYVKYATLIINDGTIESNSNAQRGGAIYNASYSGNTIINGGTITGNTAQYGNAIYHSSANDATAVLKISGSADISGNDIYLSNGNGDKYIEIISELQNSIALSVEGAADGRVIAEGSDYTLTFNDMAKLSVSGSDYVLNLSENKIKLATTSQSYPVYLGYDANGGSGAPEGTSGTITAGSTDGASFTLSSTRPERSGHSFLGWNKNASASSASYQPGASINISENTTLYAIWAENASDPDPDPDPDITITYKDQGGAAFSGIHGANAPTTYTGVSTPLVVPSKDGYNFKGWYANSDCTGNAITSLTPGEYPPNSVQNIVLYAKWEAGHVHCVCGAGHENVGNHSAADNHTFTEWTSESSLPSEAGYYYLRNSVSISSTWEPVNGITLCLNGHDITCTTGSSWAETCAIKVTGGSTFTLTDCKTGSAQGTVTHSEGRIGSGVIVANTSDAGTFNMYGGIIAGNQNEYGGGVFNSGIFNMCGGSITGNTATHSSASTFGGGVHNQGTFNMYGGGITGNKAKSKSGGGVCNSGTFTVSGLVDISGNLGNVTDSSVGTPNNVYLSNRYSSSIITVGDGGLSAGSRIGVNSYNSPTASAPIPVTDANDANYLSYFTLDSGGSYELYNDAANANAQVVKLRLKIYTVTYKPGANGAEAQQSAAKTHGTALVLPNAIFTRTGFTQTGWATSDGDSEVYNLGGSYTANADISLYPVWSANTYTVAFFANGENVTGTMDAQTHTYNTALALTANAFERAGYTFSGWNTSADGTGIAYADMQSVRNLRTAQDAELELFAQWTADSRHNLSGTVTESSAPVSGANVTLKQGAAEIASTETDADGNYAFTNLLPDVYNLVVTKDSKTVTLMLVITAAETTQYYTQNVELPADGTKSSVLIVEKEDAISEEPAPAIVVGGLEQVAQIENANITMTVTQKAESPDNSDHAAIKQESAQSISIYLDVSLTKGDSALTESGNVLEIVIPYDFSGKTNISVWRVHGVNDPQRLVRLDVKPASPFADGTFFADTANGLLYVYACKFSTYAVGYTALTYDSDPVDCTLRFDACGGSAIATVRRSYGASVDLSAYVPDRDGYTFEGWYGDANLTRKVTSVKLTANTTVYAKWLKEVPFFTDVDSSAYYYDALLWAVENGVIDSSDATFSPDGICTRAQAVTLLWRAAGSPASDGAVMPFNDVKTNEQFYNAVLWAAEARVTNGTSPTSFSPGENCTRGHIVTFLYRMAGMPEIGAVNPFDDVSEGDYYTDAVRWAVKEGITVGTTASTFSPDDNCTRAQVVTFLWRYLGR